MNHLTEEPETHTPPAAENFQAAHLTHELRAPVTAIRLGLEILQEQCLVKMGPDEGQMLMLALKNTIRLENLINDIMDYSKLKAGRLRIRPEAVKARDLLGQSLGALRVWAASKGVELREEVHGPLPTCRADPGRIVQALTNLISNAIKFTPRGGRVIVSARAGRGREAGSLVFCVSDTGCGIPTGDHGRIFDAFHQSATLGKDSGGTGLGLSLARLMVSLHRGRIWVESRPGEGSSFFFSIPVAVRAEAPAPRVPPKSLRSWLQGAARKALVALNPGAAARRLRWAALLLGTLLAPPRALGEGREELRDRPSPPRRAAQWVQPMSALRLPAPWDRPRPPGDWAGAALAPKPARKIPRLFKLVQAFTDDVQVASLGEWIIRLRLEIK